MIKPCVILATLFCHNVNAEWGEQWGSMVWGQSSTNVPMMGDMGQLIFFGLLLVIGVLVTRRWGLIKTLPAIAVLSLTPIIVDAVQVNTFQNGQVADANEVNENFNNLNQVVQELKETIKRVSCNAVEGVFLNDECLSPELDSEIEFENPVADYILLNIDTSSFEFESSNNMEINIWVSALSFNVNCQLTNATSGVISTFILIVGTGDYISNIVPIQDREMHTLSCTTMPASISYDPVMINIDVEFY
ncbi:hypothetical protein N9F42_02120 [Pseudomonadales bacterium]|nr:hypothetical protein [Pseudomonadales bacterium]